MYSLSYNWKFEKLHFFVNLKLHWWKYIFSEIMKISKVIKNFSFLFFLMLSHWTFIGWVQSVECTGFACLVQSSSDIWLFIFSPAESQWCHDLILPKQACSSFKNITNLHYVQSVELKYYFPGKETWRNAFREMADSKFGGSRGLYKLLSEQISRKPQKPLCS